MLPLLSPSMKEKDAVEWMASLGRIVLEGEQIRALARVSSLRPLADGMAVTNRRLLLFSSTSLASKGPLGELSALEIGACKVKMRAAGRTLVVYSDGREPRNFATVRSSDADFIVAQINGVADVRPVERPIVDVYDPLTSPSAGPTQPRTTESIGMLIPELPSHTETTAHAAATRPPGLGADDRELSAKRLVPLWKSIPAWAFIAFFPSAWWRVFLLIVTTSRWWRCICLCY